MDSQSATLETATGSSNQSSSDSIVSATRSGASSISTTANLDETENNLYLAAQIKQLQEEKKLLEGRIRGYLTLSDLLVEARKENQKLQAQVMELQAKERELTQRHEENPLSTSLTQTLVEVHGKGCSQQDQSKLTLGKEAGKGPEVGITTAAFAKGSGPSMTTSEPSELAQGCTFSFRNEDPEETHVIQLPKSKMLVTSLSGTAESSPTQESLEACSTEGQGHSGSPSVSHSSSEKLEVARKSALNGIWDVQENGLQLDSDKYSEGACEKFRPQLGSASDTYSSPVFGASGRVTSCNALTAASHSGDFPSLGSVNSTAGGMQHMTPVKSLSPSSPPSFQRTQQSFISQASDAGPQGLLTHHSESLPELLSSDPNDMSPSFAAQVHQLTESVAKIQQREVEQKKLMAMVMQENRTLKTMVREREKIHAAELAALREENTKLRQSKQGIDELSTLKTSSAGEWVQVERAVCGGEPGTTEVEVKLADRVRKLELANAELQVANSNWKTQWEQIDHNNKMKIHELSTENATLHSRLNEQMTDYEHHMAEAKRRFHDEETAKEDALHQLRLAERRIQELEDQQSSARSQLSDVAREKQAVAAELNILKAQLAGKGLHGSGLNSMSSSLLETEIAALKQQLTVFAEDFEQERQDRALAQAARDTAKKANEALLRQVQQLSMQIKHLQKQVKDRDDTIASTLRQNESLQQLNGDLKKKLSAEWDARQTLHRALNAAQRQQQQQKTLRNPYFTSEPHAGAVYPTGFAPYLHYHPSSTRPHASQVLSPEHLPGAWTCPSCTYVNYPGRSICEVCGEVRSPTSHPDRYTYSYPDIYSSDHALLMSRGLDQHPVPRGEGGDLVTDSA